jgi:23S rRNA (guanosine2251-2'-O)-methyltransferase
MLFFFISLRHGKEHQIFGINNRSYSSRYYDKVYIQKEASSELMKDLMKVMNELLLCS